MKNIMTNSAINKLSAGRIGGTGSHWWHMTGLRSSRKIMSTFICRNADKEKN